MIRKFTENDAETCSKIMIDCINKTMNYKDKNKEFLIKMSSPENIIKKAGKTDFFVFEKENKIIGTGVFDNGEIRTMFIAPEYQKKGFGKKMLDFLIAYGKKEGYKKVFLNSSPEAVKFYEKNNFRKIKDKYDKDFIVIEMELKIS